MISLTSTLLRYRKNNNEASLFYWLVVPLAQITVLRWHLVSPIVNVVLQKVRKSTHWQIINNECLQRHFKAFHTA